MVEGYHVFLFFIGLFFGFGMCYGFFKREIKSFIKLNLDKKLKVRK